MLLKPLPMMWSHFSSSIRPIFQIENENFFGPAEYPPFDTLRLTLYNDFPPLSPPSISLKSFPCYPDLFTGASNRMAHCSKVECLDLDAVTEFQGHFPL